MKTILPLLAILISTFCQGQSPYIFSTYSSEYIEIQDGTPIDVFDFDGTHWDDPEFEVPLSGFDILGQAFNSTTQAGVGSIMGFLEDNGDIVHGFGIDIDIIDGSIIEGDSASEISYVSHITPEFTSTIIQFSNVAFYEEVMGSEPGTSNRMSFQIQFDTPSNAMSIHFGPSSITDPDLTFYGEPGPFILLALGVDDETGIAAYLAQLSGDPANPSVIETFDSQPDDIYSLNGMPLSGRVYRFEPATNGIAENEKPTFSINPTFTTDYIHISGDIEPNAGYHIFDLSGKEIQNGKLNTQKSIDVADFQSGFYLLSIDGTPKAVKFLKTE